MVYAPLRRVCRRDRRRAAPASSTPAWTTPTTRCSSASTDSPPTASRQRFPDLAADAPAARVLRSVLMKPEHEAWPAGSRPASTRWQAEDLGGARLEKLRATSPPTTGAAAGDRHLAVLRTPPAWPAPTPAPMSSPAATRSATRSTAATGASRRCYFQRGIHGSAIDAIRRAARGGRRAGPERAAAKIDALAPQADAPGRRRGRRARSPTPTSTRCSPPSRPTLDDVRERQAGVVALDEIEDPHNFGAILRSAVAAGARRRRRARPRTGAALGRRRSRRAPARRSRIPIARASSLSRRAPQLKERGYWVVGLDGGRPSAGDPERYRVGLRLGPAGRARGRQRGARDAAGRAVRVRRAASRSRSAGEAESLNASVAAGVALFAAVRERD